MYYPIKKRPIFVFSVKWHKSKESTMVATVAIHGSQYALTTNGS